MGLFYLSLYSFLAFVIVLSIVVFVHEFGHYIVAKNCGIKVESFSIGFGRELFGWNDKSGTRWKVSILPFGGYVKMFGDEDISSSAQDRQKLQNLSEQEKKQTFFYQNVWKRIAVVFAGPFFNIFFTVLVLTGVYRIEGLTYLKPIVNQVIKESPAEKAGIIEGDLIVDINGQKTESFEDVKNIISIELNKNFQVGIIRDNKYLLINVTSRMEKAKDQFGNKIKSNMIGIVASTIEHKKVNLFQAFWQANIMVGRLFSDTLKALGQIIVGHRSLKELGGPIRIAKYSGQSLNQGLKSLIWFIVLVSANLGLMNLLPIPMLDGGHLFFYLIEVIRRRPLSEEMQEKLFKVGFIFLIALMIFATMNDIINII
jgi:regulator of sigma E protease